MNLTQFTSSKKTVNVKSALRRMRALWYNGPVNRFDERLSSILDCSLEEAAEVRREWETLGFLAYDRRGLLCWRNGGF